MAEAQTMRDRGAAVLPSSTDPTLEAARISAEATTTSAKMGAEAALRAADVVADATIRAAQVTADAALRAAEITAAATEHGALVQGLLGVLTGTLALVAAGVAAWVTYR